ncbi:MAG: helix-turn-helix domain-containing protein [Candidatus Staskawiczbacteria bacterium]|jgi:ATP-dependent protease HslVU (ClpYQ) peptidase subunit
MKNFNLKDESGDRNHFTQIPNMIVNHSTAYEQSLYLIMKRLAGEKGYCFASLNTLSKKMGVHKTTVSRTITKLLKREWIKETAKTKVIGGSVRTFIIVDLWRLNFLNYESGAKMTTQKSGANKTESGAIVDESGAKSDTSNIYNKINNNNDDFFKNVAKSYKDGERKFKPFYRDNKMRWVADEQKWYVIINGEWLEFADKESAIEWK